MGSPAARRPFLATPGRLVGPCQPISPSRADYQPAPGITRYLCGTQPIISMAALECGLDTLLAAEPLGGMAALRAKSLALTDLFIELVETRCAKATT
jgi:kynureninase